MSKLSWSKGSLLRGVALVVLSRALLRLGLEPIELCEWSTRAFIYMHFELSIPLTPLYLAVHSVEVFFLPLTPDISLGPRCSRFIEFYWVHLAII